MYSSNVNFSRVKLQFITPLVYVVRLVDNISSKVRQSVSKLVDQSLNNKKVICLQRNKQRKDQRRNEENESNNNK